MCVSLVLRLRNIRSPQAPTTTVKMTCCCCAPRSQLCFSSSTRVSLRGHLWLLLTAFWDSSLQAVCLVTRWSHMTQTLDIWETLSSWPVHWNTGDRRNTSVRLFETDVSATFAPSFSHAGPSLCIHENVQNVWNHEPALLCRTARTLFTLSLRLSKHRAKLGAFHAWNQCLNHTLNLANAYIESVIYKCFLKAVEVRLFNEDSVVLMTFQKSGFEFEFCSVLDGAVLPRRNMHFQHNVASSPS
jgi:hypothetical protein